MHQFAVIGESLPHTYSPIIHGKAIDILGLDAKYTALEIPADQFSVTISDLKSSGTYDGFNVTIPYKTQIIKILDEIDDQARAVGAVNTIKISGSNWHGFNTDIAGYLNPLSTLRRDFESALILGSGGSARAVVYALVHHLGINSLTISARNTRAAEELIGDLSPFTGNARIAVNSLDFAAKRYTEYDLVVNTTPVGMYPDVQNTPFEFAVQTDREIVFYDLVYNPQETRFLKNATKKCSSAVIINGLEMLISQAARSFEIWTGVQFPENEVRNYMRTVLS